MPSAITTERIIGRYTGRYPGPLLIVFGGMHGNEPAGVEAIRTVFTMLEDEPRKNPSFAYRGRLVGICGNLQAFQQGIRFLKKDLNRQFTPEQIAQVQQTPSTVLDAEDLELKALLDTVATEIADYQPSQLIILDLHTTTAHGGIFSIATDDPRSIQMARSMHAPVIIGMLDGIRGTTLHHFTSEQYGIPTVSVTFEAGQHQEPLSVSRAIAAVINLLRSVGSVQSEDVENRHDQLLIDYSLGLPSVAELLHVHPVRPDDNFVMEPGFINFQPITKGQLLANDRQGPIYAPFVGRILMPLYQPQGEDGFFVVREVSR